MNEKITMTIIELRPQPGGRWKVFVAPGVGPVFPDRAGVLSYAESRMRARAGEIRILDLAAQVQEVIPFRERMRL
jgi:hypothetical protein